MTELPILITQRSVAITMAAMAAGLLALSIAGAVRKKPDHVGDILGRAVAASIVFGIPVGIAAFGGLIASALLIGIGAPPMTYGFIALGSLVTFRAALKHPGQGMEGCTKMCGLVWSGYALVWSGVSFEATGGIQSFAADASSLRWLQPPLAALLFALAALKLTDRKKRTAWLFVGTWVFVAAVMAIMFLPVERGFASAILPASDWLRFPLFALGVVAAIFLFRALLIARGNPRIRRTRMRDLRRDSRLFAAILVVMGLAWAGARALLAALV